MDSIQRANSDYDDKCAPSGPRRELAIEFGAPRSAGRIYNEAGDGQTEQIKVSSRWTEANKFRHIWQVGAGLTTRRPMATRGRPV